MSKVDSQVKNLREVEGQAKRSYKKPEVKKYQLVQQTTGYVIYYYIT